MNWAAFCEAIDACDCDQYQALIVESLDWLEPLIAEAISETDTETDA